MLVLMLLSMSHRMCCFAPPCSWVDNRRCMLVVGHAAFCASLKRTAHAFAVTNVISAGSRAAATRGVMSPASPADDSVRHCHQQAHSTFALGCSPSWRLLESNDASSWSISVEEFVSTSDAAHTAFVGTNSYAAAARSVQIGEGSASAAVDDDDSEVRDACQQHQHHTRASDWLNASVDIAVSLGINPATASEAEHRRVFHLYLPVFFWLKRLLENKKKAASHDGDLYHAAGNGGALVVGVNAPQGCGKTTLVEEMQRMLEKAGHPCSVLSIDDFYLTRAEQVSYVYMRAFKS